MMTKLSAMRRSSSTTSMRGLEGWALAMANLDKPRKTFCSDYKPGESNSEQTPGHLLPAGDLRRLAARFCAAALPPGLAMAPALQNTLVTGNLLFGKQCPAASAGAAPARIIFSRLGIVNVVVVGELFAGRNIPQRNNPNALIDLVGLAVGLAGVVDEGGHAEAVDYSLAVFHAEQVSYLAACVHAVGFPGSQPGPGVFQHLGSGCDWRGGVDASTVQ